MASKGNYKLMKARETKEAADGETREITFEGPSDVTKETFPQQCCQILKSKWPEISLILIVAIISVGLGVFNNQKLESFKEMVVEQQHKQEMENKALRTENSELKQFVTDLRAELSDEIETLQLENVKLESNLSILTNKHEEHVSEIWSNLSLQTANFASHREHTNAEFLAVQNVSSYLAIQVEENRLYMTSVAEDICKLLTTLEQVRHNMNDTLSELTVTFDTFQESTGNQIKSLNATLTESIANSAKLSNRIDQVQEHMHSMHESVCMLNRTLSGLKTETTKTISELSISLQSSLHDLEGKQLSIEERLDSATNQISRLQDDVSNGLNRVTKRISSLEVGRDASEQSFNKVTRKISLLEKGRQTITEKLNSCDARFKAMERDHTLSKQTLSLLSGKVNDIENDVEDLKSSGVRLTGNVTTIVLLCIARLAFVGF